MSGTRTAAERAAKRSLAISGGTSAVSVSEVKMTKLSKRQAEALKSWCDGAVIRYAAVRARREIGTASTVASLCKRMLVAEIPGVDAGYKLTAKGVDELRRRGFFTRPVGKAFPD